MTEDEAFIRVIVDSPGDDTPRLAYADWLDEQNDPRGKYLRAEHMAVASGDISRLQDHLGGLDAVWISRVSRPPLGVCCDRIPLSKSGPRLDLEDVRRFEEKHGVRLPHQYVAFLLNHNGGSFWPYRFPEQVTETNWALRVEAHEVSPLDRNKVLTFPVGGLGPLLVIRDDVYTTYLLLGLTHGIEGQVYLDDMYYNYEYFGDHGPFRLASTLAEFLDRLELPQVATAGSQP